MAGMNSSFNDDGGYQGNTGPRVNEGTKDGVELRLDPSTIQGMEDYQPGDKVSVTIEFTLGDPGEDGMSDAQVSHVEVEPMAEGPKRTRMMNKKPNMAGTNLMRDSAEDEMGIDR